MPRGSRGGMRDGAPNTTYANRTDLNTPLPARVASGQTYGKATQQLQAQRTVPMAPPPQVPALPPAPAAPGAPVPGAAMSPMPAMSAPPVAPGQFGPVDRPSERPWEPVTHGAPVGAGAGPEALPQGPASPMGTNMSALLGQIARSTGSSAVAQLAARAAAAGT